MKQHKQVAVDGKILDRYVGRYGLPPDLILTVRREGDHLSVQENDEPKRDLLQESETDFFSTASDDVMTFESDGQAKVTTMTPHAEGKEISITRID